MLKESEWKEFMEYSRSSKDDFFKSHPQSPLSIRDRAHFDGLNYFPLNFSYRLILNLYEYFYHFATKQMVIQLMVQVVIWIQKKAGIKQKMEDGLSILIVLIIHFVLTAIITFVPLYRQKIGWIFQLKQEKKNSTMTIKDDH